MSMNAWATASLSSRSTLQNEYSLPVFADKPRNLRRHSKKTQNRLSCLLNSQAVIKILMCKINTYHRTSGEWRNRKHQDTAPPWRQIDHITFFQCSGCQLGDQSSSRQVRMKKHTEETRTVCDACTQQLFTLPRTPQQDSEKNPNSAQETDMSNYLAALQLPGGLVFVLRDKEGREWESPLMHRGGWWHKPWAFVQTLETTELKTNREEGYHRLWRSNSTSVNWEITKTQTI